MLSAGRRCLSSFQRTPLSETVMLPQGFKFKEEFAAEPSDLLQGANGEMDPNGPNVGFIKQEYDEACASNAPVAGQQAIKQENGFKTFHRHTPLKLIRPSIADTVRQFQMQQRSDQQPEYNFSLFSPSDVRDQYMDYEYDYDEPMDTTPPYIFDPYYEYTFAPPKLNFNECSLRFGVYRKLYFDTLKAENTKDDSALGGGRKRAKPLIRRRLNDFLEGFPEYWGFYKAREVVGKRYKEEVKRHHKSQQLYQEGDECEHTNGCYDGYIGNPYAEYAMNKLFGPGKQSIYNDHDYYCILCARANHMRYRAMLFSILLKALHQIMQLTGDDEGCSKSPAMALLRPGTTLEEGMRKYSLFAEVTRTEIKKFWKLIVAILRTGFDVEGWFDLLKLQFIFKALEY